VSDQQEGGNGQQDQPDQSALDHPFGPDPIADIPHQKHDRHHDPHHDDNQQQSLRFPVTEDGRQVGRHVGQNRVIDDVIKKYHDHPDQQGSPVISQNLLERQILILISLLLHRLKGGRFFEAFPQVISDQPQGTRHQKGNSPSPLGHGIGSQGQRQQSDKGGACNISHQGPHFQPAGHHSPLFVRRRFGDEGHRSGILSARRKPLRQSGDQQ